jgi:hypothetical protein
MDVHLNTSNELQNNKQIVLEVVKQGYSLYFASNEFKNNKEIVLEAVKQNGLSPQYASEELQNDREIEWKSKHYFKFTKQIDKLFDLKFQFNNE